MSKGLERIAKDFDHLVDDTLDYIEPRHDHGIVEVIGNALEHFFCDYLDLC